MKHVIILETNPSEGGLISIRAAFWLDVPPEQAVQIPQLAASDMQRRNANHRRVCLGAVLSSVGLDGQIQAYLDRAAYIASVPLKGQYYGVYFDGAWHLAGT